MSLGDMFRVIQVENGRLNTTLALAQASNHYVMMSLRLKVSA